MSSRFKPGDLVVYQHRIGSRSRLHGIVLEVIREPWAYRDSTGAVPVHNLQVLWDQDVPSWMGKGKITCVPDQVVELLEEVPSEGG